MPIYEYSCKACGHRLEALQGIQEAVLTKCPACQKKQLKRLISSTSFQLKGSGWYATDFKQSNQKKADKTGKADTETSKPDKKEEGTAVQ